MGKPAKLEFKLKELVSVAAELNKLLDPDPKIRTVAVKVENLIATIQEAASLIQEGDELSESTHGVLVDLEVELPEGVVVLKDETESSVEVNETAADPEETEDVNAITKESLVALASEMNEVMALDPAIEIIEDDDLEFMKDAILAECYDDKKACQIYETDQFSDEAWATLKALGIIPVADQTAEEEAAKAPEKPAKEKTGKVEKPKKEKAEKPEKQPKAEKKKGTEKTPKTPSAAKKDKVVKYTRAMAICETIKSECVVGCSINDLLKLSDEKYAENVENAASSHSNAHRYIADALILFDILKVVDGKFKLV